MKIQPESRTFSERKTRKTMDCVQTMLVCHSIIQGEIKRTMSNIILAQVTQMIIHPIHPLWLGTCCAFWKLCSNLFRRCWNWHVSLLVSDYVLKFLAGCIPKLITAISLGLPGSSWMSHASHDTGWSPPTISPRDADASHLTWPCFRHDSIHQSASNHHQPPSAHLRMSILRSWVRLPQHRCRLVDMDLLTFGWHLCDSSPPFGATPRMVSLVLPS